jgi:proline racemase
MRWQKTITVVDAHAEGEIGRVVTGGVLFVPGATMHEKKDYLETRNDWLRRFLLFEPRGHVAASANLIMPPTQPEADVGVIIMESDNYLPMSGSNAICVTTVLLETGMIAISEPETRLVLETPGGLIPVTASCRDGKCERVTLTNVPAFVSHLASTLEVPDLGSVGVDVAYGGAFFVIVDAEALGFKIVPHEARNLAIVGERIKAAAQEQLPVAHPENPDIHDIIFTLFAGPFRGAGQPSRNAVVVTPGRLDRSPCGTGTTARLAVLRARGLLEVGDTLPHDSILDTRFLGTIVADTLVAGRPAVVTTISGRAWLTGIHQYGLDPADPFPEGYTLSDTWLA